MQVQIIWENATRLGFMFGKISIRHGKQTLLTLARGHHVELKNLDIKSNAIGRKVISNIQLAPGIFVLRFERKNTEFLPGQYLTVGSSHLPEKRDYSIFSGTQDDFLEILIRKVSDGLVSPGLESMRPGQVITVGEPAGYLQLQGLPENQHIMVASGTGISPFSSFARSISNLNYLILHGVRTEDEAIGRSYFPATRYLPCISGTHASSGYLGRVTNKLKELKTPTNAHYYLCGNSNMIYDVFELLGKRGISVSHIHTEVYF